jgi:hypothetical protein
MFLFAQSLFPTAGSRVFPTLLDAAPVVNEAFQFNRFSSRLQGFGEIFLCEFFAKGFASQLNLTSFFEKQNHPELTDRF